PLIPAGIRTQATSSYDVLLLLQGTNDLNNNVNVSDIRGSLRNDIRNAKSAGVLQVFLSTVPPNFIAASNALTDLNNQIRSLAASENVILVDNFTALGGQSSAFIGIDGIHPTAAGQQIMAQTFFAAIQANFEVPPGTTAAGMRIRR